MRGSWRTVTRPIAATLVGVCMALHVQHPLVAGEAAITEGVETMTLIAGDGIGLTLDRASGRGEALLMGDAGTGLGGVPLVRFEEVFTDPDAPDLLGDADIDHEAWGVGAVRLDTIDGESWLRVVRGEGELPTRTLRLDPVVAKPLVISGWCRARIDSEACGWLNAHLAINVYGTYADGTTMPEQSAYFGQYDHGPQHSSKVLCPDRPLAEAKLVLTSPGADCTAWFRGIEVRRAQYAVTQPVGQCERIDGRVVQEFADPEAGLRGVVTYQPTREGLEIRGRVASDTATDRALSAYFALPIDAIGGRWHDDARRSRVIEAGGLYRNTKWYGAGRDGYDSQYPLGCLETADGIGVGLAVPPDEPRVFQIEYDAHARELRVRFDLGLSPDAGRWADRGAFTARLFAYDTRDGFRGAMARYYDMYSWAFEKRVEREGLWLAFISPKSIPGGPEGLGFQFIEATNDMGWASREGMVSLKYAEPWIHHHEAPPHAPFEVTHGRPEPSGAIALAREMAASTDPGFAPEHRRRFAGYLASYISDPWEEPQGYFFRSPGGRNENMMIVNPNPALPPAEGALYVSGDWDREVIREASLVWRQWSLPGWDLYRASERPSLEVDTDVVASGAQSVRFDPSRSKHHWEHYVRGMSQVVYCGPFAQPPEFRLCLQARGESVPESGAGLRWTLELQAEDGTLESHALGLADLGSEWRQFELTITPQKPPMAARVLLVNSPWLPDPTVLWVDNVSLTADGVELLTNGDLEDAELLNARLGGVYLDTMECYENNLNHRREHWPYADEPPTFDAARRPALQQQFSHVQYAREMAHLLRDRGLLLFGNCAPVTAFGAPYLDIMGGEEFWMQGGAWTPKSDASFSVVRFLCGQKPFCLLQYSDLDAAHQERYIKRCLFYGVFPGNQSTTQPAGKWYWTDAHRVARDRPSYAKYMPLLLQIASAGWQPLTLAESNVDDVWLERWGEGDTVYWTVFSASTEERRVTITLDPRSGVDEGWRLTELVDGADLALVRAADRLAMNLTIAPEDVRLLRAAR